MSIELDHTIVPSTDPADSFLVSADEMRSLLGGCGFITELFEDTSDTHLSRTIANATPAVPGQLGLAVFVENLAQKAANGCVPGELSICTVGMGDASLRRHTQTIMHGNRPTAALRSL